MIEVSDRLAIDGGTPVAPTPIPIAAPVVPRSAVRTVNRLLREGQLRAAIAKLGIRTVYVPIFKNHTFRRGYEFHLTRAVVREIEAKTPYKVVSNCESADTELVGTIITFTKRVINANQLNEVREAETTLGVEVVGSDKQRALIQVIDHKFRRSLWSTDGSAQGTRVIQQRLKGDEVTIECKEIGALTNPVALV